MKKDEVAELKEEYKRYRSILDSFGKSSSLQKIKTQEQFFFANGFVTAYQRLSAILTEKDREITRLKVKLESYREDEFLRYSPNFQRK